jgi:hypothetical protein
MTKAAKIETGVTSTPTARQVWHDLKKSSFAVVSEITPGGEPRSSGVIYRTMGDRLFVAVAPDGWKAKHFAANPRVSVTVPVRRGGILMLMAPIPPATISFHGTVVVHPAGTMEIPKDLEPLLPAERRAEATILEIVPEGSFLTYGIGVPLMKMRDPAEARGRVPVVREAA